MAPGASGDIEILSERDLAINNGAFIGSYTSGDGVSGNIDLQSEAVTMVNEGSIFSITAGQTNGGNIDVRAQTLSLTETSQIGTIAEGDGQAGDINVSIAKTMTMSGKNENNFKKRHLQPDQREWIKRFNSGGSRCAEPI